MNHPDYQVPIIASANLSLGGLSLLVSKVVPHLATIAVLLQIAVGAVSLWQMLKKRSNNEKTPASNSVGSESDRL